MAYIEYYATQLRGLWKDKHKTFETQLCFLRSIPDVARVRGRQSVNVQTEVSHGEVEHKEVAGVPHLLHREERHDADGVEEESQET